MQLPINALKRKIRLKQNDSIVFEFYARQQLSNVYSLIGVDKRLSGLTKTFQREITQSNCA